MSRKRQKRNTFNKYSYPQAGLGLGTERMKRRMRHILPTMRKHGDGIMKTATAIDLEIITLGSRIMSWDYNSQREREKGKSKAE